MTIQASQMSAVSSTQIVAIESVDPVSHSAVGLTRQRTRLPIDTRYHVGGLHITPAAGEQWCVARMGRYWVLDRKLPHNTAVLNTVADNPVEGQVQIGSSGGVSGPLQLHGSAIVANGPLVLSSGNSPLPQADDVAPGTLMYDGTEPVYSNGSTWVPWSVGVTAVSSGGGVATITAGSIVMGDLEQSVQTMLTNALQGDTNGKLALGKIATTGTPDSTRYLRGDGSWSQVTADTNFTSLLTGLGLTATDIAGLTSLLQQPTALINSLYNQLTGTALGGTLTQLQGVLGNIPTLSSLVQSITGVSGGLSTLSNWATSLNVSSAAAVIDALYNYLAGTTGVGHTIQQLQGVVNKIPLIGPLVYSITGVTGDLNTLGSYFASLNVSSATAVIDALYNYLVGTLGQAGASVGVTLSQLKGVLTNVPLVGPLVYSITGVTSDLSHLGTWFTNLGTMLGSPLLGTDSFNPATAIANFVNNVLLPSNLLLGINSALDATKLGNLANSVLKYFGTGASTLGKFDVAALDLTNQASTIFRYLTSAGLFDVAQLSLTNISSSVLKYFGTTTQTFGQFQASQLFGTLNPALTFAVGDASVQLSTLLQHLSATGQYDMRQLSNLGTGIATFLGTSLTTATQALFTTLATSGTLAVGALSGLGTNVGAFLTSTLQSDLQAWLSSGGALPSATRIALSQLSNLGVGISTFLGTNLSTPAQSLFTTLATNATLAVSALSGLGTNVGAFLTSTLRSDLQAWLVSGGALPSSVNIALSQLTSLGTGVSAFLGTNLSTAAQTLLTSLATNGTIAVSALSGLGTNVGAWLQSSLAFPLANVTGLGTGISTFLQTNLATAAQTLLSTLATNGTLAITALSGLGTNVLSMLQNAAFPLANITNLGTNVQAWLANPLAFPLANITGLGTGVQAWLQGTLAFPIASVTGLGAGIQSWLQSTLAFPLASVTGLGTGILSFLQNPIKIPPSLTGSGVISWDNVVDNSALPTSVKTYLTNGISPVFADAFDGTAALISGIIDNLDGSASLGGVFGVNPIAAVMDLQRDFQSLLNSAGKATTAQLAAIWQNLSSTGTMAATAITGDISTLLSSATTFGSLLTNLFGANSIGSYLQNSVIPNITKAMSTDLQGTIDAIYNAINGGTAQYNNTVASVQAALRAIPTGNLAGLGTGITTFLGTNLSAAAQSLAASGTLAATALSGLGAGVQAWLQNTLAFPIASVTGLGTGISTFLQTSLSATAQALFTTLATNGTLAVSALSGLGTGVQTWLSGTLAFPLANITGLGTGISTFLNTNLSTAAQALFTTLATNGTLAVSALSGLGAGVQSWLSGALAFPLASITGLGTGVQAWLQGTLAFPLASITGLGTGIQSFLQNPIAFSLNNITGLGAGVSAWLGNSLAFPLASITGLGANVQTWLQGALAFPLANVTGLGTGISTFLGTSLSTAAQTLFTTLATNGTLAISALSGLGTGVQSWLSGALAFPLANITGLGTGVQSWLQGALAFPLASITGLGTGIQTMLQAGLGTGISTFLQNPIAFPLANITGLGSGVQSWLQGALAFPLASVTGLGTGVQAFLGAALKIPGSLTTSGTLTWDNVVDNSSLPTSVKTYLTNGAFPLFTDAFDGTAAVVSGIIDGLDGSAALGGIFGINPMSVAFDVQRDFQSLLNSAGKNSVQQLAGLWQNLSSTGTMAASAISGDISALLSSATTFGTLLTNLFGANSIGSYLQNSVIPNITKAMSSDLQGTIDAIYQAVNGGSAVGNSVASVLSALKAIPAGNLAGLGTGILSFLQNPIAFAVSNITGLGTGISTFLQNPIAFAAANITGLGTGVSTFLGTNLSAALSTLATGGTLAATALSGLGTNVGTFLTSTLRSDLQAWLTAGGALPSGVNITIAQLSNLGTGVSTFLTTSLSTAAQALLSTLATNGTIALSALSGLGTGVATMLQNAAFPLANISGLGAGVQTWLQGALAFPIASVTGLGTGVSTWLQSTLAFPLANITGLGAGVQSWLQGTLAFPLNTITGLGTGISTFLGGNLSTAAQSLLTSLAANGTIALGSLSGLGTGVATMLQNAAFPLASITGLGTGVQAWLQSALAFPLTSITGLGTGVQTFLGNTLAFPLANISGLGTGVQAWLQGTLAFPLANITGLGTGVSTFLGTTLSATAQSLLSTFAANGTLTVAALSGLGTGVQSWLQNSLAFPVGNITGLATGLLSWLQNGGPLPAGVSGTVSQIVDFAAETANKITTNPVVIAAQQQATNALDSASQLGAGIQNNFDGTISVLSGAVDRLDGTFIQAATSGMSDAQKALAAMNDAAANGLAGFQEASTEIGSKLYAQGMALFSGFTGGTFDLSKFGFPNHSPVTQTYTAAASQQATLKSNSLQLGGTQGLSVSSVRQALQRSGVSQTSGSGGYTNAVQFPSQSSLSGAGLSVAAFPASLTYYQQDLSVSSGQAAWTGSGVGPLWQAQTTSASSTVPWQYGYTYYTYYYYWKAYLSTELVYNSTPTTTSYQVVDMVLASANQINNTGTLGGVAGAVPIAGFVYLVGRLGPATGTNALASCVYAAIGNGYVSINSVVNGSNALLASVAHTAITGATYELVCGNPTLPNDAGIYQMSLYCNGVQLLGATANSSNHFCTSAYRMSGFGAASVYETVNTQEYTSSTLFGGPFGPFDQGTSKSTYYPATIDYWGVQDNATPAAVGSGFQVSKVTGVSYGGGSFASSAIAGTVASWQYYTLQASWFDTIVNLTLDFSWSPTTNTVTVGISGWYMITVTLNIYFIGTSNLGGVGFLHNGAWSKQTPNFQSWGSGSTPPLQNSFIQYCLAGDTITPVMVFAGTPNATPVNVDTTGAATNFSMCLMNCGTLS